MIRPTPQSDADGCREDGHESIRQARTNFDAVMDALPPIMEGLQDETLDELRPQLTELMQRLLEGTRMVVEMAERLQDGILDEVEMAQRSLSERLLDFRRAMGSGSTDTIRKSLHADLEASAMYWNRLLDGLAGSLPSNDHENA